MARVNLAFGSLNPITKPKIGINYKDNSPVSTLKNSAEKYYDSNAFENQGTLLAICLKIEPQLFPPPTSWPFNTLGEDYANNKVTLTKGAWHKRTAGGVSGVFENFYNNGLIYPETSIRNTASGYSWKFTTTNSSNATSGDPLALNLGTIAVNGGNKTVTVTVYAYRTSLSAFGRLKIKQNQLIGLTSDVTATTSGGINTWEQLSLTFNPSSSGYVDIAIEAYDGSSNVYFDDVGVTQAT